ncbi:hypothetical protein GGF46_004668 [Coemansia sp. RSA 552]|nr:hypothetical protein GGF46_004668 [Coemansia sp. RSA 552]
MAPPLSNRCSRPPHHQPASSATLQAVPLLGSGDQQYPSGIVYSPAENSTPVTAALAAVALGAGTRGDKRRFARSPQMAAVRAVKAGAIHKSKGSTSSVSSTSTVGSRGSPADAQRAMSVDDERDEAQRSSSSQAGEETAEQVRRRKFLERNRVAASKCRQKKKLWVQELERRAEDVTMQNRSLHIAVAQLKEEVMVLKNQLLAHRNCNCSAIHQYLQAECAAAVAPDAVPLPSHQPALLPPPAHVHSQPAMAAVAAAAAASSAPQLIHGTSALLMQPPPHSVGFRPSQQSYAPHVPHHQHASSVDLSSIAPNPAISAMMAPPSAAAFHGAKSTSPKP